MKIASLVALVPVITIASAGCGGDKSAAPTPVSVRPPLPSGPISPQSTLEAANDSKRISNVIAVLRTAASIDLNKAGNAIAVRVEHDPAMSMVSVRSGSEWSIGVSDGSPTTIEGGFGPWAAVSMGKDLGEAALYVDVFTDIEAPRERVVDSDGTLEGLDRSLARLESNTTVFSESHGISGLRGTYDGMAGVFSCVSPGNTRCRASRGNLLDGKWTFLPDRPMGAKDIDGVAGVVFTGNFNPDRTAGTLDGEAGYFRCTSQACDRSVSEGRLISLTGDWIFVPTTREIVTETDSDYLALGVWLVVPADESAASGYSFGSFATGNDPFDQGILLSLSGAATYRGNTVGIYASRTDEDEVGRFTGIVELIARFGGSSSLGTIRGAVDGLRFNDDPVNIALVLEETAIGSSDSGLFEGVLSGYSGGITYAGTWGGRFFGNDEISIKPTSVAGTIGGSSDSGMVTLVGSFGAYRSQP